MKNKYGKLPYGKTRYAKIPRARNALIMAKSASIYSAGLHKLSILSHATGNPALKSMAITETVLATGMALAALANTLERAN